jgi:3-dehydroquinate synthase
VVSGNAAPTESNPARRLTTSRTISLGRYDVLVAPGALASIAEIVADVAPAHRYAIVTDDNVRAHYAERVAASLGRERTRVYSIPAGESHKTREQWATLTDAMLADGLGRDSAVVALGGGVVGDLAGFVAATFMRGIPVVQVPTTLLAMIDASVGGKTGVDTPAGKNLVGAFHHPAAVVADPHVLSTLPREQMRAGLAEALKHGVIADAAHFEQVLSEGPTLLAGTIDDAVVDLVATSVEIKADVVRRDEREGGIRKTLNFGHTLGHAIEALSGYSLLHGEAVAIGMVLESEIAERVGLASPGMSLRVRDAVERLTLPHRKPADQSADEILAATRSDKKARAGAVEYALPSRIGAMAGADTGYGIRVPDDVVREVLR